MHTNLVARWTGLIGLFVFTACGPVDGGNQPETSGKVQDAERIDYENEPNRFRLSMTRVHGELPSEGISDRKPFPSNWWPMRRGGIAYRWLGSDIPSPAEKYDDLTQPNEVSEVELTLAQKDWEDNPVNEDAEPETFNIGPTTEWEHVEHGRYGETDPESWWGHCNGWASYAINEDEPIRPVDVRYDEQTRRVTECAEGEEGCTRFELGDINALGSELYWSDGARMLGRRCEEAESDFELDREGRIDNVRCRDGNAAALHIVATNMLGRLNRPFIVDLTADRQVWNFPVYRFELDREQEIDLQEALREMGRADETITATSTWEWNEQATRFIRVHMRLWIVEDSIPPSTQPAGPLLERYTTIENYDYILELDDDGTILGGEWVGRSKLKHPDFLWYSYSNSYYPEYTDDLNDRDNTEVRFSVWKQILTLSQNEPAPPDGVVRVESEPNLAIPDNDAAGVSTTINVEETFNAERVTARVRISHTYRGDLRVTLSHGETSVVLHDQAGGSNDNLDLAIDVADFAGAAVDGEWTLTVSDHAGSDTGSIDYWSLDLLPDDGNGGGGGESNVHEYTDSPNLAIPDDDADGVSATLAVTDEFVPTRVRVSVDITHTYRGDLIVELQKDGQTFTLANRTGGSTDNLRETFDVSGYTGNASGTWTLRVVDTAGADVGSLASWTLELTEEGDDNGGGNGGGNNVTREFEDAPGAEIPDNNADGVATTITVDEDLTIESLRVEVNITHTYIGDLTVTIEKEGVTQTLHDNEGRGADNINRTYDTRAFGNMNVRGTWTLRVVDSAGADVGTIDSWKLIATGN